MSNKVLLKKSSVLGKAPETTDLDYGELALNYADGLLYFKNASNNIQSFAAYNSATVTLTATQTLTNKTLTSPTLNTPSINGGTVSLANGTLVVPVSASPSQTDTASIVYDSGFGVLTVGSGAGRKQIVDTSTSQTLTNKTLTSPTISGGALSGTFSGAHTYSGVITLSDTTASTSSTTGALKLAGGLGVVKNINSGGSITAAQDIIATQKFRFSTTAYMEYNATSSSIDFVFV